MAPVVIPSKIPSSPIVTASTSLGPGKEVKMMSHFSDNSLGESAHVAPISIADKVASLSMSWTMTLWPDRIIFKHIPLPIFPKPMKPMFFCSISFSPI